MTFLFGGLTGVLLASPPAPGVDFGVEARRERRIHAGGTRTHGGRVHPAV
jgi:hypothetical protein